MTDIKDANPNLTPAQIKKILMETVDSRSFMSGKVVSNGIANAQRATKAAALSISGTLDDAISTSHMDVADQGMYGPRAAEHSEAKNFVLPMTQLFKLSK